MAEAARRYGGLGADAARRLIARPIHRQGARASQSAYERLPEFDTPAAAVAVATSDQTRRLEAELRLMKAVVAAERRENANLRASFDIRDESLGEEARAVRARWAALVDELLQAGL